MGKNKDANPAYWDDYNNLQHTKHALIEEYLKGWFPKLGFWSGKILYVDTHAGRGKHKGGKYGSPIVALRTFLEHQYRESILKKSRVAFYFIEADKENCESLQAEIDVFSPLPSNVEANIIHENCFDALQEELDELERFKQVMAPAFVFVDPYGFKIPGEILQRLMRFKNVELFINVIWRWLSMAISQAEISEGMAKLLDSIYNGDSWRKLIGLEFDVQAIESINLLRNMIDAKWATHIHMLGSNNATKYLLLHLTNHDAGRDLMKDCMWKICPEGGFYARSTDDPSQQYLITREPDLKPLEDWVWAKLESSPIRWTALLEDIRHEIWRAPQLNAVIRKLKNEGKISGRKYTGKFFPKNNPELYLC